ncbi:MAG: hypothetical protein IIB42_01580 [Candidatus Marinimicrobia bacterium]|nr:hypothetical protein [Candidatus Neomarinimicrobiota bacterium]MCH7858467.1 hypothetical protein [Candidatus Neomarinimicrobiota bacterium]
MKSLFGALIRAVQLVALLSVVGGLYLGYRNRDMGFELNTLAIGAGLFYLAAYIQRRWL